MADRRMRVCWQLEEALDKIADLELRMDVHRFPQEVQDVIMLSRNAAADALSLLNSFDGKPPVKDPTKQRLREWRDSHSDEVLANYWKR